MIALPSRCRRRGAVVTTALLALGTSGCAERRLVSSPAETVSTGTWAAVWCAGVLIAVLLGVLLTLPAWRTTGGARFATALFTAQAGAVTLASLLLVGVAVRSWQLIDRPVDAAPTDALVRLSRTDGDTAYFALMVLLVVVLGALLVTLLALGARFARSTDPVERLVACAVLAIQLGAAAYLTVLWLLGEHGWPFLGAALATPLLAIALATCWPPRGTWDLPAVTPPPAGGLRDSAA